MVFTRTFNWPFGLLASNLGHMKIAVCIKQVPDSWAEKKMVNSRLDREGVDAVLNDLDEYEWKGDDLWIRRTVSFAESLLGFDMEFSDHPNGAAPTYSWKGGPLIHGAVLCMNGAGMPRKSGGYGNMYIQIMVTPLEVKPWSTEDATKLQSVFGGASASLGKPEFPTMTVYSSESRLAPERS
jgi:hypothetical protein